MDTTTLALRINDKLKNKKLTVSELDDAGVYAVTVFTYNKHGYCRDIVKTTANGAKEHTIYKFKYVGSKSEGNTLGMEGMLKSYRVVRYIHDETGKQIAKQQYFETFNEDGKVIKTKVIHDSPYENHVHQVITKIDPKYGAILSREEMDVRPDGRMINHFEVFGSSTDGLTWNYYHNNFCEDPKPHSIAIYDELGRKLSTESLTEHIRLCYDYKGDTNHIAIEWCETVPQSKEELQRMLYSIVYSYNVDYHIIQTQHFIFDERMGEKGLVTVDYTLDEKDRPVKVSYYKHLDGKEILVSEIVSAYGNGELLTGTVTTQYKKFTYAGSSEERILQLTTTRVYSYEDISRDDL